MATTVPRRSWRYGTNGGAPPVADLLLDDSLASHEIEALFTERGIPHRLSRVEGLDQDRPAVYIDSEGPAGTFFYGPAEISFYFLSRFEKIHDGG